MTNNQKAQARIFFENRIFKADGQAFEDLFIEIMNYKESDFQTIKPWGNIGDRKNDGYIKSRGIFYQVYAPEDIRKSYPKVIDKIKTDFKGLIEQWSNVQKFYFVVNDKYKGVNPDSEQLLQKIKENNNLKECKFITAKDLENILFSLSNDQIIKVTGVSFHDSTILTPAFLRNTYLKKFNTISLLTTPKPIDEIFINLAIIKEENEGKDKKKEKYIKREVILNSYEEIYKPKEPIEIKELINKAKKSLIYGKAGVGKTTLCKYIAYKWAKEELYSEFEYVIYISLRKWNNEILKEEIRREYRSQYKNEINLDIENNPKILFLFDGYDELKNKLKESFRTAINDSNLTHYIITTRPYGYQKNDFSVDEQFETIGFTDENVEKYIETFFKDNNKKSKGLKKFLQNNISIKHIAYIPLMLEMICSLWQEKEFSNSLTITELYTKSIENIFFEYTEKNGTAYIQDKEEGIFDYLGKIAFEGLKQQTIILDKSITKITTRDFFLNYVLKAGFLNGENLNKSHPFFNNYQFTHLTFQEYFSALYVYKLSPNEQSEIIRDWKFYPHMQVFFAFLGGLIEDKEFLLDEILSRKNNILIYNRTYICMLILDCLQNIKKDELSKEKIELIEHGILREFDRTLDYPFFLEKLKLASSSISNTIVNHFIEKINNDKNTLEFRKDLTIFLFSIGRYDESIKSAFIEILKHPKWGEEVDFYYDEKKIIDELLSFGSNDIKNINICFTIIEKYQNFNTSIEVIEKLLEAYPMHKNTILNSSMRWLKAMINHDEKTVLSIIIYNNLNNSQKGFLFILIDKLINSDNFINSYREKLGDKAIDEERKLFIAIFLYSINKENKEVLDILTDKPLKTFNSIVENNFPLLIFIKKNMDRNTNIFHKLESLLKKKKINLSYENSHKMLEILIRDIGSQILLEEVEKKILNFITEYYIENENIDLQHRKNLFRPTRFYIIQDSNKTVKKFLKEINPSFLTENRSVYNNQNKTIEKVEKKLFDILKDKNANRWDIEKSIKENWNKNNFLVSIQNKDIELKNKKIVVEAIIKFNTTQDNLIVLIEIIRDEDIELMVRRHITKTLYEKGFYSNEIFHRLIEFIKETDLKFIVKVNSKIKYNRNIEIIDALIYKLNKYYEEKYNLINFFQESGLCEFIDKEQVADIFFRLILHPDISSHDKKDLLRNINNKNFPLKKGIDTLIKFIQNRKGIFYEYDWQVVHELISPIWKITNINNYNILKKIIQNSKISYDWNTSYIQGYSHGYEAREKVIVLLAKSPNADNFLEDKNIPQNAKKLFTKVCSTENLFEAYRTEYKEMIRYMVYHLRYNKLSYYIKDDKKLYTISRGQEISTKEINKDIYNSPEIQKALQEQSSKENINIKLNKQPLIITEGKTDWKHLKKALERFKARGEYPNLDIEFDEYKDIGSGESNLDNRLKSLAKQHSQLDRIYIGIFDRDTDKYVKEYGKKDFIQIMDKDYKNRLKEELEKYYGDKSTPKYKNIVEKLDNGLYQEIDSDIKKILTGEAYQDWTKLIKNKVYAFCIPEIRNSNSPRTLDKICIEFYYKEEDLKIKYRDRKRLFFTDEFELNPNNDEDNSKRFISKCGKFKTTSAKVKNGATAELTLISKPVYSIDDEECKRDLLLSKNDFTKYIENDVEGFDNFDIENFRLIFDVIEKIVND